MFDLRQSLMTDPDSQLRLLHPPDHYIQMTATSVQSNLHTFYKMQFIFL